MGAVPFQQYTLKHACDTESQIRRPSQESRGNGRRSRWVESTSRKPGPWGFRHRTWHRKTLVHAREYPQSIEASGPRGYEDEYEDQGSACKAASRDPSQVLGDGTSARPCVFAGFRVLEGGGGVGGGGDKNVIHIACMPKTLVLTAFSPLCTTYHTRIWNKNIYHKRPCLSRPCPKHW